MWGALGGLCARVGYGGGERILWVVGGQCGRRDVPVPPVPSPPAMGSPGVRAGSLQSGDTRRVGGKRSWERWETAPLETQLGEGEKKKLPRGFPLLFQSKLVKYFSRQLSCKRKVALQERNAKLEGFPQLLHWFRIVDIRKEVMEVRHGHGAHGREVCCGILE